MADSNLPRGFQLVGEPTSKAAAAEGEGMSFGALVLSLTTSGLLHLGVSASEELDLPEAEIDLEMGSQTIAILEMLRAKTRGNLDREEAELLDRALHDLRLRYVEVKRQQAS